MQSNNLDKSSSDTRESKIKSGKYFVLLQFNCDANNSISIAEKETSIKIIRYLVNSVPYKKTIGSHKSNEQSKKNLAAMVSALFSSSLLVIEWKIMSLSNFFDRPKFIRVYKVMQKKI
jgi:hypothetical protein